MTETKSPIKVAVCVNNADFPASLELYKIYRVLPDDEAEASGDLRVVDESGEDYLYPAEYFVLADLPEALEINNQDSKERNVEKQTTLDKKISSWFQELLNSGEEVKQTRHVRSDVDAIEFGRYGIDYELAHKWGTSCLSLFERVYGSDSAYYEQFETLFPKFWDYGRFLQALGVLKAALDDYMNGHLFDTRTLVEAEVFDDFLDQGRHLLDSGYYQPAAVVIGSVLEDGLRKLCTKHEISLPTRPKLDTMNADLAKRGVYSKLTQKRITALADIRNNAAHGNWDAFTKADVEEMLRSVRQFMETHFT